MALTQTQVSSLYVTIFGRASEGEGNTFWQTESDTATAANAMLASDAAITYFGSSLDTDQAFIEHIYLNTLGKTYADDSTGIDFWVKALETHDRGYVVSELIDAATDPKNAGTAQDQFNNRVEVSDYTADNIATADLNDLTAFDVTSVTDDEATLIAAKHAVDVATPDFKVTAGTAGTSDVMHLSGQQDVRIDFTDTTNQITGLDLNNNGAIDNNGVENNQSGLASGFEIVDAYARNPLNANDKVNNFLGDIAFDGTGYAGDGVSTDGNIFLGGLGSDTAFGGIGNDFMTGGQSGGDDLNGGRNADFFFVELSELDNVSGDSLSIDGGSTFDNDASQDSDWLLLEASDDNEPVTISLNDNAKNSTNSNDTEVIARSGTHFNLDEVENLNASGNLYGFVNDIDVKLGDNGKTEAGENVTIGSTAQLVVAGSDSDNIIIGGYDNDTINAGAGDDIIFGGDMQFNQTYTNNPNILTIKNDGSDTINAGAGNDQIHFELDDGSIDGGTGNDTIWLTDYTGGLKDSATAVNVDLGVAKAEDFAGYEVASSKNLTNVENVDASGLGAIDYDIDGANAGELDSTVQNYHAITGADLILRGSEADNNLIMAADGNDILEGRGGNDTLAGYNGNDDFIFELDASGDGLDTISRKIDANGDNIWDTELDADGNTVGVWGQDFGVESNSDNSGYSILTVDFPAGVDLTDSNVGVTQFEVTIDGVVFGADLVAADLYAETTTADLATLINTSFNAQDANVSVVASDADTILVRHEDSNAVFATSVPAGTTISGSAVGAPFQANLTEGAVADNVSEDRLIFRSYEDRADNELMDDDHDIDSVVEATHTTSLGATNYAEDLVATFGTEGSTLTEGQSYTIDFKNLNEQDKVSITVNGVTYTATVGLNPDGTNANGDYLVAGDTAAGFVARFANLINNSDDDTQAGSINMTANLETLTVTQRVQIGGSGEDIYMDTPIVTLVNASNGEKPTAVVTETSNTHVFLDGFDGRDANLHGDVVRDGVTLDANVIFDGDAGINRSIFETATTSGGVMTGLDALAYDTIADADTIVDTTVHGDDLLFTAAGNDQVTALTGDDRVFASKGTDSVDGGKDHYNLNSDGSLQTLNVFEAAARNADADLTNDVTALQAYTDTLVVQQADYATDASFTVALDAGLISNPADATVLSNGTSGTVTYNEGAVTDVTTFTNMEMVRTISGNDTNVANDTLDMSAVSNATATANATGTTSYTFANGLVQEQGINYALIHGTEHVVGGNANDTVTIDEAEVGKVNNISLGNEDNGGLDTVAYDFTGYAFPNSVTMTVTAETANEVDTVSFNGAVLDKTYADTLTDVEVLDITQANVAARADDVLDITNINNAVVAFGIGADIGESINGIEDGVDAADNTAADLLANGGISTAATMASEILTINGIDKLETINASTGNDRIVMNDANLVSEFAYTFNMGDGTDTLDMRAQDENLNVEVSTATDSDKVTMTDVANGNTVVTANSNEVYYGGTAANTIDLSTATVNTTIEFSQATAIVDPNGQATPVAGAFNNIEVRNTADATEYANFVDAGAANDWTVVDGSTKAETVIVTDNESKTAHDFNLSSGANIVDYSAISDVEPDDVDASNAVKDSVTFAADSTWDGGANSIDHTVSISGTDHATELNEGYGTDTIATAANALTIKASTVSATDTVDISEYSNAADITGTRIHVQNVVNLATGVVQEVSQKDNDVDGFDAITALTDDTIETVNTINIENFENITGSNVIDLLTGNGNANVINADAGNDIVNAGAGDDTVEAGAGDDTVNGDAGADSIRGGAGKDTLNGGDDDDKIVGDAGNDTINGGTGDDTLDGGDDDDTVSGGTGNDTVSGGAGINRIIGGAGVDTITIAPASTNTVVFDAFTDSAYSVLVGNQGDTVEGFVRGTDTFEVHIDDGIIGTFTNAEIASGVAADLDGDTVADDSQVTLDVNGDGTNDIEFALLNDVAAVSVTDFTLAVDMSSGADAIDISVIDSVVNIVFDAQADSTLGARDVIDGFELNSANNDVLDFRALKLNATDFDVSGAIDLDEIVKVQIPVSVDNAATMTNFFNADVDLNADGTVGNENVLFVLQNEQGTSNYRLFVDLDQNGSFDQASDMVIDFTNTDLDNSGVIDAGDIPANVAAITGAINDTDMFLIS